MPSDAIGRPGQRHVDPPEQIPGARAVDPRRLRELGRHGDEVGAHPEHGERHEQADERQDDRQPGVEDAQSPDEVVERRDDALERQRQAEHEQEQQPTGRRGCAAGRSRSRPSWQITSETGTTPSTMSTLETAAARPCSRPGTRRRSCPTAGPPATQAGRHVPDGWSAVVKMLMNGRTVIAISSDQQQLGRCRARGGRRSSRSVPREALDRQDDEQHQDDRARRRGRMPARPVARRTPGCRSGCPGRMVALPGPPPVET